MLRNFVFVIVAAVLCDCSEPSQEAAEASRVAPKVTANASVEVESAKPASAALTLAPIAGVLRQNNYMKLMVTEGGFVDPAGYPAPLGQRYYAVGLRGTSRSRSDVAIEIKPYVYAQNERGCISKPEIKVPWLTIPFGDTAVFSQSHMTDGQLAFPVPKDSKQVRVLIASADGQGLAVPAGRDFTPSWPTPVSTIEDGSTMRVMVLPKPDPSPALPAPPADHEYVVLDFAVENLSSTQGVEFQTTQQLRLRDATGSYVQASAVTNQIGCRLEDGDVIPPGHVRRFMVAYDMPAGAPISLQYRGFELEEAIVDLQ